MSAPAAAIRRSRLDRLLGALDWMAAKAIIAAMAVMVVVVAGQVFLRYVLNLSLDWAEEISRLLFIWSVFLAIPLGIRRGAHVGVSLLTNALPPPLQRHLFRAMNVTAIVLMAIVLYEAAILTKDQWDEPMATLDFSVGWFMLPLAIGAAHSALHLLNGTIVGPPARSELVIE